MPQDSAASVKANSPSALKAFSVDNEHRIFGPPGTGKTTRLSREIRDLVETKGTQNVMVVSFTKSAAVELVRRGLPIPEENVRTLHSFGFRALGGKDEIAEQHLEDWNSEHRGLEMRSANIGDDDDPYDAGGAKTRMPGEEIFQRVSNKRARGVNTNFWSAQERGFFVKWQAWKTANGFIDFQDMIDLPRIRQIPPPGNPRFGVFDEVQDFTLTEMALVRYWGTFMEQSLLAGDDDQAIYFFKGADHKNFIYPAIPEERKRVLDQSWRVPSAVQEYAERWIKQVRSREPKLYRPKAGVVGAVRNLDLEWKKAGRNINGDAGAWSNPEITLNDAERYLADGKSVMFLASCSYMLKPLEAVLRKRGIPFHNPYRTKRGDWNPLISSKGISSTDRLLAFLRLSPDVWGENGTRIWTLEDFIKWTDALGVGGVLKRGVKAHLDTLWEQYTALDDDARYRELDVGEHLMKWMEEPALNRAIEQSLDWFESHLLANKQDGMRYPLTVARTRGAHTLLEAPKVILGTIHSVKGGEADVVYLFPDLSRNSFDQWLGQDIDAHDSIIRTMYVGMTRPKDTLVLCRAQSGMAVKFL